MFVGCVLQFLQNACGYNIVQYYGPVIMKDAGFNMGHKNEVLYSMVVIGGVLVLGNIIAMKKANDYGRREAVLFSTMPMAISQSILAVVVAYNQLSESPGGFYWGGWISILCMSVFMFFCALGFAT